MAVQWTSMVVFLPPVVTVPLVAVQWSSMAMLVVVASMVTRQTCWMAVLGSCLFAVVAA